MYLFQNLKCIFGIFWNVFVSKIKQWYSLARSDPPPPSPTCVLSTKFKMNLSWISNVFVSEFEMYLCQILKCIFIWVARSDPPPPSDVCLNQPDSVIQWRYTCSPSSAISLLSIQLSGAKVHKMWFTNVLACDDIQIFHHDRIFYWFFLLFSFNSQSHYCDILGWWIGKLKHKAAGFDLITYLYFSGGVFNSFQLNPKI